MNPGSVKLTRCPQCDHVMTGHATQEERRWDCEKCHVVYRLNADGKLERYAKYAGEKRAMIFLTKNENELFDRALEHSKTAVYFMTFRPIAEMDLERAMEIQTQLIKAHCAWTAFCERIKGCAPPKVGE